jgi:hypothetical protein
VLCCVNPALTASEARVLCVATHNGQIFVALPFRKPGKRGCGFRLVKYSGARGRQQEQNAAPTPHKTFAFERLARFHAGLNYAFSPKNRLL